VALEHLLAALEADAETKIAVELGAAREQASRLEAESGDRIARLRAEALQQHEMQFRQETERLVAASRREARQELLLARQRLLQRVLRRAVELAPDATRSSAYLTGLPTDLARALSYLDHSEVIVRCSPELGTEMHQLLAEQKRAKVEIEPTLGAGFVVAAADGSAVVDRTLPRRLLLEEPWLRQLIVQEIGEA
jgi:vacuolar-type H+-ATPase subunit E/Vma4